MFEFLYNHVTSTITILQITTHVLDIAMYYYMLKFYN
jgi:hypothetical protein